MTKYDLQSPCLSQYSLQHLEIMFLLMPGNAFLSSLPRFLIDLRLAKRRLINI